MKVKRLEINNALAKVTQKIDDFNSEAKLHFKLHVDHEIQSHKKLLPHGMMYSAIHEQITNGVNKRMDQFTRDTDLKPQELYSFLGQELVKHPNLSKRELHFLAYDHLEKNTKNKFLKKIYKKMRKQMK